MKSPRIHITSKFWSRYEDLVSERIVPYQWSVISDGVDVDFARSWGGDGLDAAKSHAIENLRIAAGRAEGHHHGMVFQDSDVYKWLETAAYALAERPSDELRQLCDSVVDLIADAQDPDGYLSTMFQIEFPQRRFKRLYESHELYCMGHCIEACVAYRQATGSEKALRVATGMADCIDHNFGPEDGKIHATDGHPEIELALARLFEETGERRYLDLARYLVDVRGRDVGFYARQLKADGDAPDKELIPGIPMFPMSYYLYDKPVDQLTEARGHAVRVTYLFAGLAHIAHDTGDQRMLELCHTMWNDIVKRKIYITGGIGSTADGEAFTRAYDLPNDTTYCETCASVGMVFFAQAMLGNEANGEYADVVETELYNGVLAGMSLDGTKFFYVNPLDADPEASVGSPEARHVLTRRADWFPCACCPSNISRLLASLGRYVYTVHDDGTILVDQFIAGTADFGDGTQITQTTNYPWEGSVNIHVTKPEDESLRVGVRIPGWAFDRYRIQAAGSNIYGTQISRGFAYVNIPKGETDVDINLELDMRPRFIRASNRVKADVGQVALRRGPVVYCAESADNQGPLWAYRVSTDGADTLTQEYRGDELEGVVTVTASAMRDHMDESDGPLYMPTDSLDSIGPISERTELRLIPYFAWANRAEGQMRVWFRH